MDFRDVVHATQSQMLKQFVEKMFSGSNYRGALGTLPQIKPFTDWTAEMKAKASICISEDDTFKSLEIAQEESDHDR
jgi:aconitate hydratase 2/2-methylisocitrate dehydratase